MHVRGTLNRRQFLGTSAASAALGLSGVGLTRNKPARGGPHLKLSCNLYSFNAALTSRAMTLEDVIRFCADLNFEAVDPTGYYFPGYPSPPSREYINRLKRLAFVSGLDISGTGVRNDFTVSDPALIEKDLALVKTWVEVAAHLGAPVVRVFSGKGIPEGSTEEQTYRRVAEALRTCAMFGREHGVMIVLQNHADLLTRADQVLQLLEMVDSEWLGVNLDVGSFRTPDPYDDIARLAPHAVTWQIKENLTIDGREVRTDLDRIVQILHQAKYRGYIPIETLGAGDPREKVPAFLEEVRLALRRAGDAPTC